MTIDNKTKYCQSCGIPLGLHESVSYGTNSDSTSNNEFCAVCFENGKYIFNFSMDYILYLWGLFPDGYNEIPDKNYTPEELRNILSQRLPTLKRWEQKINTVHTHYEHIVRVQEFINRHLFEELSSELLSRVACMSMYHFRQIFKEVTGERLGNYIQRLRLEYIAFKLISTETTVSELIGRINFQNKHTLSRAFKKHFKMSIPDFRKLHIYTSNEKKNLQLPTPSINRIDKLKIAYLKYEKIHKDSQTAFLSLWNQVFRLAKEYNLLSKGFKYVSLSLDNPNITDKNLSRFLVGITVPDSMKVPKGFSVYEIPPGQYAVFRFKGVYHELHKAYRDIYLDWLPQSGYGLREQITFETYINTPDKTISSELKTDIYLPIIEKNQNE